MGTEGDWEAAEDPVEGQGLSADHGLVLLCSLCLFYNVSVGCVVLYRCLRRHSGECVVVVEVDHRSFVEIGHGGHVHQKVHVHRSTKARQMIVLRFIVDLWCEVFFPSAANYHGQTLDLGVGLWTQKIHKMWSLEKKIPLLREYIYADRPKQGKLPWTDPGPWSWEFRRLTARWVNKRGVGS